MGASVPHSGDAILSNGEEIADVYIHLWLFAFGAVSLFTVFNVRNYLCLQVFNCNAPLNLNITCPNSLGLKPLQIQ